MQQITINSGVELVRAPHEMKIEPNTKKSKMTVSGGNFYITFKIYIYLIGVGALRLVRNHFYSTIQAYTSGIVEIYYGGVWGNICDDSYFGYNEANVICHQLAFTGVSSYGYAGSTST